MIFSCGKCVSVPESVQPVFLLPLAYETTAKADDPFFLPMKRSDFSRFVLEFRRLQCIEEDFENEALRMFVRLKHIDPAFYRLIKQKAKQHIEVLISRLQPPCPSNLKKSYCSKLESFWNKTRFLYPACVYTAVGLKPQFNAADRDRCIVASRETVNWQHGAIELPKTIVIKRIDEFSLNENGLFPTLRMNEIHFLSFESKKDHPNIHYQLGVVMKYLKSKASYHLIGFVSEFANYDSILAFHNQHIIDSGVDVLLQQFVGIAEAINSMHQKGWVHHDIKMENIFVNIESGSLQLKLADFGSCDLYTKCKPYAKPYDWEKMKGVMSERYPLETFSPTNNPNHYKQYDWKMFSYVVRDTMRNISSNWHTFYPFICVLVGRFNMKDYLEMEDTFEVIKRSLESDIKLYRKIHGVEEFKFSKQNKVNLPVCASF